MTLVQIANNLHILYFFLSIAFLALIGICVWCAGQSTHTYVLEKRLDALEATIQEAVVVDPSPSPFLD